MFPPPANSPNRPTTPAAQTAVRRTVVALVKTIVLVERAQVPGPELGDVPRPSIVEALDNLGVERRLGCTLVSATADASHLTIQSCQHAQPMGKYAGHNVAADLLGMPMLPFNPDSYGTCIDLGDAGALVTTGWERTVQKTGQQAKEMKRAINTQWIYPPVDSAEALLAMAGHFGKRV